MEEEVDDRAGPVREVRFLTHVGDGLFGTANLLLLLAELIREGDDKAAVPLALMGGEGENTSKVVTDVGILLLAVVPDGMETAVIPLA